MAVSSNIRSIGASIEGYQKLSVGSPGSRGLPRNVIVLLRDTGGDKIVVTARRECPCIDRAPVFYDTGKGNPWRRDSDGRRAEP